MSYSGIDLLKDSCFITTIKDEGAFVPQRRVPNEAALFLACFAGRHKAVMESITGWYWLSDLLEAHR